MPPPQDHYTSFNYHVLPVYLLFHQCWLQIEPCLNNIFPLYNQTTTTYSDNLRLSKYDFASRTLRLCLVSFWGVDKLPYTLRQKADWDNVVREHSGKSKTWIRYSDIFELQSAIPRRWYAGDDAISFVLQLLDFKFYTYTESISSWPTYSQKSIFVIKILSGSYWCPSDWKIKNSPIYKELSHHPCLKGHTRQTRWKGLMQLQRKQARSGLKLDSSMQAVWCHDKDTGQVLWVGAVHPTTSPLPWVQNPNALD